MKVGTLLCAFLIGASATAASASVVAEVESNDSLATAQNLDGLFTTGSDPNVTDAAATPYVTVISGPAGNNADWYSFTVGAANSTGIFDIDFGMPDFDSTLRLYDSVGNNLTYWDDAGFIDAGSVHSYDTYATYTFADAGLYYLSVGSWSNPNATGDYKLNISLQSPGVAGAVPEPSTWAMMLLGFGAIGSAMRRRRNPAARIPQIA